MKTLAVLLALVSFTANANPPTSPPGHPTGMAAGTGKPDAPLSKKGKVLSSVDAKSFTYIEVQDGAKKLWVVSPTVAVKAGNTISYADAPVQAKYHSASLNREFTNVVFTARVVVDK